MARSYKYSIRNDTANGAVNLDKLTLEIRNSNIVIALDHIDVSGDDVEMWFKADLDQSDVSVLNSIVAMHDGQPLPGSENADVNIAKVSVVLPSQEKGFKDLSGHNVYRVGPLMYVASAGKASVFCEKFNINMYIHGGGVYVPEYVYINGVKTDNKPEWGDYCVFDVVDLDNKLGYGKKFDVVSVERRDGVLTIRTSSAHNFVVGEKVYINVDNDIYDRQEATISSIGDDLHVSVVDSGLDVDETSVSGYVSKIVVLAPFIPVSGVYAGMSWDCSYDDAKLIPAGIYLRFRYVSLGSSDVYVMPHYQLRT